jgi:hypothetical protein
MTKKRSAKKSRSTAKRARRTAKHKKRSTSRSAPSKGNTLWYALGVLAVIVVIALLSQKPAVEPAPEPTQPVVTEPVAIQPDQPSTVTILSERSLFTEYGKPAKEDPKSWFSGITCGEEQVTEYVAAKDDTINFIVTNKAGKDLSLNYEEYRKSGQTLRVSVNGRRVRDTQTHCNAEVIKAGESIACEAKVKLRYGKTTTGKVLTNTLASSGLGISSKVIFRCP